MPSMLSLTSTYYVVKDGHELLALFLPTRSWVYVRHVQEIAKVLKSAQILD